VRRRGAELEAEPMTIRSAQTSLLARASGYVTIEEDAAPVEAGGWVNVSLFSSGGAPIETA
jgi:molybdopterin biosynthesis enzyme